MKQKTVTLSLEFDVDIAEEAKEPHVATVINMAVQVALVKHIGMIGEKFNSPSFSITGWETSKITFQDQEEVVAAVHALEAAVLAGARGYKLQIKCECGHNEEDHEQGGEYAGECKKHCGCFKFRGLPRQAKIVKA